MRSEVVVRVKSGGGEVAIDFATRQKQRTANGAAIQLTRAHILSPMTLGKENVRGSKDG
jgi:hypothetical protein